MKAIDLCGKRFGSLVAGSRVGETSNRNIQWSCQCDCGEPKGMILTD